jgi:hypothetical protein
MDLSLSVPRLPSYVSRGCKSIVKDGVNAQQLLTVDVELEPKTVTGTDIAPMLRGKGYNGP